MIPDLTIFWVARREDGQILGGAEGVWTQALGPTGWTDVIAFAEDFPTDGPARDEWSEMFGEIVAMAVKAELLDMDLVTIAVVGPWRIEATAAALQWTFTKVNT